MSDLDRDVRTLLEAKAEEMRLAPEIPGGVVKRARRRRVVTTVVAGAVTLAAAVGFYAGASALLQDSPGRDRGVVPAGTGQASPYGLIYPPSEEELDNITDEVAQGSMPLWQSPRGVAELFAVNVLGWDPEDVEVENDVEEFQTGGSSTAVVTNPSLSGGVESDGPIRTTLTLVRLPYSEIEMYAVVAAQTEGLTLERTGSGGAAFGQGSLEVSGILDFATEGMTVELRFDGGEPVSAPVVQSRFALVGEIPGGLQPTTIMAIAAKDDAGRTLSLTSYSLAAAPPLDEGTIDPESTSFGPATVRVITTLEAIHEAASAADWEALRALIPERGFTFSFGLADDPIAYWQDLEAQGEPVLETLATIVQTKPAQSRGTFILPYPAVKAPQEWDASDLAVMRAIHTEREIKQFQEAELYFGWRVGIERDGTWIFFVAGD